MGNGILSRSGSGDGAKIGDIRLSTRDSIGAKWALCNGDLVESGSPIVDYCSFDPSDVSNWVDLSPVIVPAPTIVLYDPSDNTYWGIRIDDPDSYFSLYIYKYDRDERGQYQTAVYTDTSLASDDTYIYDACFIHDEEQGNKIAFAYYTMGEEYIIFYDINTNKIDRNLDIYIGSDGAFSGYAYDTGSTIRNGGYIHTLASAGRFVILHNDYECVMNCYDSRNGSYVSTPASFCYGGMYSYASGPYHTAIAYIDDGEGYCIALVDNSTGVSITEGGTDASDNGGYMSVSCIYEESEDCEYFMWFYHDEESATYRGYAKVTASGSVTTSTTTTTASTIFGSNSATFGSMYEFKANGNYYALALNSYSTSSSKMCTLSGKAGTVSSKATMSTSGVYSADRNIFGYKNGPQWYMIANRNIGDYGEIYFTAPCLPVIAEGSYNGFIKVEN